MIPLLIIIFSPLFGFAAPSGTAPWDSGQPSMGIHGESTHRQASDSLRARVRKAYAEGRFWHGVEVLRAGLASGAPLPEEDLLLLARGEAGWGNWVGVDELLRRAREAGTPQTGELWALFGRAKEALEDWAGARVDYDSALVAGDSLSLQRRREVRIRRARVMGRAGDFSNASRGVRELMADGVPGAEWLAMELAEAAADAGAPEETQHILSQVPEDRIRATGWALPARALLRAGDTVGAEAAYWSVIPTLSSSGARARSWERVGTLRLARGDSLGAKGAFHQVLLEGGGGSASLTAARGLLVLGFDSTGVARRSAETLAGAGRDAEALRAWERYGELRQGDLPPSVSLAVCRLLLRQRNPAAAMEELAGLLTSGDPGVGAPALSLQAQALRSLGRSGEARAVQDSLVARFPTRREAAEILFLRADALQSRGNLSEALTAYEATAALSPSLSRTGEARMRMGRILLGQGRDEDGLVVFLRYLDEFPEGRRWDEAAFWAGRTLLALGREEEGRELLHHLRSRFALSFYSVMAGVEMGAGYEPEIPARPTPPLRSPQLLDGLARLDALRQAGLDEGAAWVVRELMSQGRALEEEEGKRGYLLALALELNQRGLTREGINLGWEVRRLGEGWSRDLLSAIYPFPYREMVLEEARERGLDPFLMAGLMRQESAFWKEARSRADARGLMQLLPGTGRQLARARGPQGFDADLHLFQPEVNVHLGMAFFQDLKRRFGDDLSIVLSAYNAGPTRALRWREYPEAGELPVFVERIPFAETRGYVKNVLLNREIYAWLYRGEGQDPETGGRAGF